MGKLVLLGFEVRNLDKTQIFIWDKWAGFLTIIDGFSNNVDYLLIRVK